MRIRQPAVAGLFYPADPATLAATVDQMLAAVSPPSATTNPPAPKVLIAPHAGHVYSGATAAHAYALLKPWAGSIRRVVLLGPTHRVAVRGIAIPAASAFATPLGDIPLDIEALEALRRQPDVVVSDLAHAQEHSLEVHLPFLQRVLPDFRLIPLAVGHAEPERVAEVLDTLWGGAETLIVVSSDLSHFLPYGDAQITDQATCTRLLALDGPIDPEAACGAYPLNGLMLAARRRGLQAHLLHRCNSGDTAGDKQRVVGYAAFSFSEPACQQAQAAIPPTRPGAALGPILLALARQALQRHYCLPELPTADHPALQAPGATFVTLTQNGQLRGCIGSLEAWRPLGQDVQDNARAAALRDPRFSPLTAEELPRTRLEVSLLTAAEPLVFHSEAEALAQLRPGIDGVIFSADGRRSTFLPQVWEQLPEPATFMAHLKQKAGLPADYWSDDVRLARYGVQKWKEPPP